jgi:hypothetical protein
MVSTELTRLAMVLNEAFSVDEREGKTHRLIRSPLKVGPVSNGARRPRSRLPDSGSCPQGQKQ